MKTPRFILAVLLVTLIMPSAPVYASASLELYGTFQAMGVIVTIAADDDPDLDASATVEYRLSGSGAYRQGFPLSRVAATRFVGSLFWLEPGTSYEVRVTFSDPDHGPLDGDTVQGTASTRAEITIPTPSKSYYVSPTGSGTECTLAGPCALSYAVSQAQAGEEVVLRGGVYYQDEIALPRSGTSGAPIVIRGYDGETAILDGADPATFAWTSYSGGVYRTTINTDGTHLVLADGQRLFPYDDLTDLQNLSRDNTPGFYADGTTLYVHLAGDANPNSATMTVSRYSTAFYVAQDYIYFLNLTFRHYGQGEYAKAIYFDGASDNLVQDCTFASNDLGIGIKRESHRNVIQDSEFYDTIFDWPWDDIKELGGLEDGGIVFYDPATGRGNVIRRNVFHDDFDGFGVCPSDTAATTNETDIYENLVYNMGDDGLETDGQCSNVRLWGNTFHDVLMGISLAPVYGGPVYAIRNLIYRTGVGNNDYSGSPFKFNSGYGPSGPMYLFHNTADAALPGNNGLYIKAPGDWELIYARNNIWAGTEYALNNYNTSEPIDLDYDDLWNGDSGNLVRWDGTNYATLAAFTAATGQEPHGLSVEPGFADAASGNYMLAPGSALIDAGLVIPGINDDYVGSAPDIGAFEYGAGAPAAVTDLRVTDALTAAGTLTATLRWTAPTNAVTYTLRYSDGLINDTNWPGAVALTVPFTATPGSTEWLTASITYDSGTIYFALKSQNAGGNWSALSNNAFWPHHDVYLPLVLRNGP
ncbi:MAG: right-handed parallel beta-helix repeat-containing protein [Anaerolineae bacterium]|nr:right-handed parallel beta-helix repeat-containing protein [Anaerolineae bacterium]